MVTIPGAGHYVIEEATPVVIEVLRDFLADDAGTTGAAPATKTHAKKTAAAKAPAKKAPARKVPPAETP